MKIDWPSYADGFYAAGEALMHFINELDSSEMTGRQVRSAIYGKALELRPVRPRD